MFHFERRRQMVCDLCVIKRIKERK